MFRNHQLELVLALMALAGGLARTAQQFVRGKRFSWAGFLANVFIAGFSGFIFALFGKALQLAPDMLYVAAGVGGFMGSSALDLVADNLRARVLDSTKKGVENPAQNTEGQ